MVPYHAQDVAQAAHGDLLAVVDGGDHGRAFGFEQREGGAVPLPGRWASPATVRSSGG